MECLQAFAARARFQLHQVVLDLADRWISRRMRWWAVLLPADMASFALPAWTVLQPTLLVGDLIPSWPVWPTAEEKALLWSEREREAYNDLTLGTEPRLLSFDMKCPTALHSWGSPLDPCPCGCRLQSFSWPRLQQFGLRGIGIHSELLGEVRYLHPLELCFLNTVPLHYQHLPHVKAAMCLIGQLAAPMQSLWVSALIKRWASGVFQAGPVDPVGFLDQLRDLLLRQRHDTWLIPEMLAGGQLLFVDPSGRRFVECTGPVQVDQFLKAEAAFLPAGFKAKVTANGRTPEPEHYLQCDVRDHGYEMLLVPKRQAKAVEAESRGDSQVSSPLWLQGGVSASEISDEPNAFPLHSPPAEGPCSDVCLRAGLSIVQQRFASSAVVCPPLEAADLLHMTQILSGNSISTQVVEELSSCPFCIPTIGLCLLFKSRRLDRWNVLCLTVFLAAMPFRAEPLPKHWLHGFSLLTGGFKKQPSGSKKPLRPAELWFWHMPRPSCQAILTRKSCIVRGLSRLTSRQFVRLFWERGAF